MADLPSLHVVGDSISLNYGPHLAQALSGVFHYSRKPVQIPGDEESANGRDSNEVLAYLHSLEMSQRRAIDILLVNCGLHDIKRAAPETGALQVPLACYTANLHTIVQYARENEMWLIWVRTTPVVDEIHNRWPGMTFFRHAADVTAYNVGADDIMRTAGVPLIDLHTFTRNLGADVYLDHVHFHPTVCAAQAAFIAGSLYQIVGTIMEPNGANA